MAYLVRADVVLLDLIELQHVEEAAIDGFRTHNPLTSELDVICQCFYNSERIL